MIPSDALRPERDRALRDVGQLEVHESLAFAPDLLERRFFTVVDAEEGEEDYEEGLF